MCGFFFYDFSHRQRIENHKLLPVFLHEKIKLLLFSQNHKIRNQNRYWIDLVSHITHTHTPCFGLYGYHYHVVNLFNNYLCKIVKRKKNILTRARAKLWRTCSSFFMRILFFSFTTHRKKKKKIRFNRVNGAWIVFFVVVLF